MSDDVLPHFHTALLVSVRNSCKDSCLSFLITLIQKVLQSLKRVSYSNSSSFMVVGWADVSAHAHLQNHEGDLPTRATTVSLSIRCDVWMQKTENTSMTETNDLLWCAKTIKLIITPHISALWYWESVMANNQSCWTTFEIRGLIFLQNVSGTTAGLLQPSLFHTEQTADVHFIVLVFSFQIEIIGREESVLPVSAQLPYTSTSSNPAPPLLSAFLSLPHHPHHSSTLHFSCCPSQMPQSQRQPSETVKITQLAWSHRQNEIFSISKVYLSE